MRIFPILVVAIVSITPATVHAKAFAPGYGGMSLLASPGERECLVSKRTHELVCKTRAEWRDVAARLTKLEQRKANPDKARR